MEERLDPRWTTLYQECRPDLYRAIAYLVGHAEAEEVVHDAFEQAMRYSDFFDEIANPAGWLRVVAMRRAVSRLRRRAVLERILPKRANKATGMPDVELHDAISRLPPNQRGAVMLHYLFGSSYAEVAQALGLSENSVGQLLSRARATLRKELLLDD